MNIMKKVSLFLMLSFLLVGISFIGSNRSAIAVTKMYKVGIVKTSSATIYQKASTKSTKIYKAKKKAQGVLVNYKTIGTVSWYRIRIYNDKKVAVSGYIKADKITTNEGTTNSKFSYKGTAIKSLSLKKIATAISGKYSAIPKNDKVTIVGRFSVGAYKWYKCKYGKSTGYALQTDISVDVDISFEENLKTFPDSYRTQLRDLHQQYPAWEFRAVNTGLDWETVIDNESAAGLCNIQSNYPRGIASLAPFSYLSTAKSCYNWAKDKYTVFDGKNWFSAKASVIRYYMDPRNFLNPERIFQFQSLKYEGTESTTAIKNMLKDTFMKGSYTYKDPDTKKSISRSYANSFLDAGKLAGISPYFLAARSRQELGINGSASIFGTYPKYEGYYNYYNVGANDSKEGLAVLNGLRFAKTANPTYLKPWDTPYKAIKGGAIYIASGYIPVGQVTNYFQKFNVVNKAQIYRHQYMSNVQAPSSEAFTLQRSYTNVGILNNDFVFYIPVYSNMPSMACKLPSIKGNPNAYLSSLSVKNAFGLNVPFKESFAYNLLTYNCEISTPQTSFNITISGEKVSKYSTITSGTGQILVSVSPGTSKSYFVKCKSQSGTTKVYMINIKNTYTK